MIVVTDGESHDGDELEGALEKCKERNITRYAIAVSTRCPIWAGATLTERSSLGVSDSEILSTILIKAVVENTHKQLTDAICGMCSASLAFLTHCVKVV